MGAAASSSSSSFPPATIVLHQDPLGFSDANLSDDNNIKIDDNVMDLEQSISAVTTMADKIKALTFMRDKTYQKLGRASASVNEETSLLLERRIKRYDAKIETLKDLEDRYDKDCALHLVNVRQRSALLNSHLMLFSVLQGLLVVAATASFTLAVPVAKSDGVITGNNHHYELLILTILGMAVSLVTLLKIWDNHSQQEALLQLWETKYANNEAISRTFSSSELVLNAHDCRRDARLDLIIPFFFLAAWSCVLALLVLSKLS